MENLLFTILGAILGWIPQAYFWARDRFTSAKARGIAIAVQRPYDRAGARYQCKIRVDITNQLSGQPVRISAPYFVFAKRALLKPDPKWTPEHGTARFRLHFFTPPKKMHE